MQISEKILRAKQDLDEVFEAGYEKGKSEGAGAFPVVDFLAKTVEELDLKGITFLGTNAISSQTLLKKLSIPDVKTLSVSSIVSCSMLNSLTFPKSLENLPNSAVVMCTGITAVTFEGTPKSIGSNAFMGCTGIKTVNVPWSLGEVANAPWGMTSAMINYNYKGD